MQWKLYIPIGGIQLIFATAINDRASIPLKWQFKTVQCPANICDSLKYPPPPFSPSGSSFQSPNHLYNTNDAISSLMSLIWHHLNISCPVGHQKKIHGIWHFPSILNLTPCHASEHFAIFLLQLSPRIQIATPSSPLLTWLLERVWEEITLAFIIHPNPKVFRNRRASRPQNPPLFPTPPPPPPPPPPPLFCWLSTRASAELA